jgi:hypothetical protein
MASIIKTDNIQKVSDDSNIIKKCGSTITLGSSGATVALATGATQTGFGRSGSVNWCTTAKTSPLTVESGKGYFINTSSGSVTVTLPASPSAGDIVAIKDYGGTAGTNSIVIANNSSLIGGICSNAEITTNNQASTLVYVDGTKGWQSVGSCSSNVSGLGNYIVATGGTVITCGDFKTHVFTSTGTFTVTAGDGPRGVVDYLVVAGGGGGGLDQCNTTAGGAGGAGGFRVSNCQCRSGLSPTTMSPLIAPAGLPVSAQAYPITIGAGGAGATFPQPTNACRPGTPGSNTIFSTITSAGGGGGSGCAAAAQSGKKGGSGGGGKQDNGASGTASPCGSVSGGDGNEPPVAPPQGNDGGHADLGPLSPGPGGTYMSGGGGGAIAVGVPGGAPGFSPQGCGGNGSFVSTSVFGPTAPSYGTSGPVGGRFFAGGGGGGAVSNMPHTRPRGAGGAGGGGFGGSPPGAPNPGTAAAAGTTNTGGGGGGGGNDPAPGSIKSGAAGGSGVVVIRYRFQN